MDNTEALSPKPDEFVENKNSRHPKGLWVLFGTECGSVSTFME
jgi:proton-dependent oligopeptide transporter, POT family